MRPKEGYAGFSTFGPATPPTLDGKIVEVSDGDYLVEFPLWNDGHGHENNRWYMGDDEVECTSPTTTIPTERYNQLIETERQATAFIAALAALPVKENS